ncbi:Outer membrane protein (porin) [Thiohalospira halophila DSM 15071]|uniref:Outer membrane protein (Porin) n=1 Tax=Thiohalospira halophila DSM 15071 TaxID=1123397 RepID=A0A1I1SSC4_9GAMM|nr:porin [Thiohalospira halophila]SFD49354.1 Outer membrane protein (porin) [Thiohalospira halophila DSM 15071]
MKKTVIALAAAAMTAPLAANAETSWFGFSQITAGMGEGNGSAYLDNNGNVDYSNDGLAFGADRVRIGYKASHGNAFAKLQVDFNRDAEKDGIGLNDMIKDAVVGYEFNPAAKVNLGVFKTPVGMDFNTSGKKLDITKRGMEKGLVLERAAGAMVSGDLAGGLGYDVGIFNPANRSSSVDTPTKEAGENAEGNGEDMAYAGRIRYDMDNLHLQASYGSSSNAGGYGANTAGEESEDYTVMDFGAKYTMNPLTAKFEYIAGENVQGIEDLDQNVMYLHGGFMLNDSTELVARHYTGNIDDGNDDLDVTNTYLGANFFLNDAARIQVNYVVAGGDNDDYAEFVDIGDQESGFGKTYTEDAVLAQFQYSF